MKLAGKHFCKAQSSFANENFEIGLHKTGQGVTELFDAPGKGSDVSAHFARLVGASKNVAQAAIDRANAAESSDSRFIDVAEDKMIEAQNQQDIGKCAKAIKYRARLFNRAWLATKGLQAG